jgi:hypothetical protein
MNALAKKLLIKPNSRWLLYNAPAAYPELLAPLPDGAELSFAIGGDFNGLQLFVKDSTELAESLKVIAPLVKDDTVFWVVYPKKSSGITTDLEMMSSWDELGKYGFDGVASAAVDQTWTALRFRPSHMVKKSDSSNEAIKTNEFANYINPETKTVTLPADVADALSAVPESVGIYDKLAYSHRKEYVVWVLSAKQEQTRLNRITKMVEMLLAGKKNPSDK